MKGAPVVLRSVLDAPTMTALQSWAEAVRCWPAGSHVWGHYAERTDGGDAICRTENVSACHAGIRDLVQGPLRAVTGRCAAEDVVAFKDKFNYKSPGGAGFSPHQDAPAYPDVVDVVSILLAIDECTTESGCLWLAEGVDEPLPTDERGVVRADVASALAWSPAELAPGDAVLLGGFTPHFSEANRSPAARRVLVASYAPSAEGYSRERYYELRRGRMAESSGGDGRFRISTLADFEGIEAGCPGPAPASCSHG